MLRHVTIYFTGTPTSVPPQQFVFTEEDSKDVIGPLVAGLVGVPSTYLTIGDDEPSSSSDGSVAVQVIVNMPDADVITPSAARNEAREESQKAWMERSAVFEKWAEEAEEEVKDEEEKLESSGQDAAAAARGAGSSGTRFSGNPNDDSGGGGASYDEGTFGRDQTIAMESLSATLSSSIASTSLPRTRLNRSTATNTSEA